MDIGNKFIDLFTTIPARLLILLSLAGCLLSIYPIYDSLNMNAGHKVELIKLWNELGYEKISQFEIDAVRLEVKSELQNTNGTLDRMLSMLWEKSTYMPWITFIFKFLFGGVLYIFVYGLNVWFKIEQLKLQGKSHLSLPIKKRRRDVLRIWLALSVINMIFPVFSPSFNYIFLPSCLTLLVAIIFLIWDKVDLDEIPKIDEVNDKGGV